MPNVLTGAAAFPVQSAMYFAGPTAGQAELHLLMTQNAVTCAQALSQWQNHVGEFEGLYVSAVVNRNSAVDAGTYDLASGATFTVYRGLPDGGEGSVYSADLPSITLDEPPYSGTMTGRLSSSTGHLWEDGGTGDLQGTFSAQFCSP